VKKARTLGLVAVMALALTAIGGASTALAGSGSGFVAKSYPGFFVGSTYAGGEHILNVNAGTIKCPTPELTAGVGTGFETVSASIESVKCGGAGGTLAANGCKLIFHPGTIISGTTFAGTVDIGPSGCGPIVIPISACQVQIGAQTGLTVTYENLGTGSTASVLVKSTFANMKYTQPSGGGCGGSGTFENGSFNGTWQIKNYSNAGHTSQQGVKISPEKAVGLYLAGKKSEEKVNQPKFEASKYPVVIDGNQLSSAQPFKFTTAAGNFKCADALLHGEVSSSTAALALKADSTGCKAFGQSATVTMNSCYYVFGVANADSPYSGSLTLACNTPGDVVSVTVSNCSVTVPPQTLGTLAYENLGAGNERQVAGSVTGEGLAYSIAGPGTSCGTAGSYVDGKFSGPFDLRGLAGAFE
jgi:hypothetical protein